MICLKEMRNPKKKTMFQLGNVHCIHLRWFGNDQYLADTSSLSSSFKHENIAYCCTFALRFFFPPIILPSTIFVLTGSKHHHDSEHEKDYWPSWNWSHWGDNIQEGGRSAIIDWLTFTFTHLELLQTIIFMIYQSAHYFLH